MSDIVTMSVTPKPRGGARVGAGAKPIGDEPMRRYNVSLDRGSVDVLRRLGNGNLSAGIRAAATQVIEMKRKKKLD